MTERDLGEIDLGNWEEHVGFLLGVVIKQSKYLNYLNQQLLKMRLHEEKVIKLLKANNSNWNFLISKLKPLVEEHEGMQSYLSVLSARVGEVESKKKDGF